MDFLGQAIELESETISAYKALSNQCAGHAGIRSILKMLIHDHEEHMNTLSRAQARNVFELNDTGIFSGIRRQLERIRVDRDTFSCDIDQLSLYREARDLLQSKMTLYRKARDEIHDPRGLEYLEKLISEEQKQMVVLDNIIEMVERPETWLEDAEFSHLDEY
jgi:hypothetical protein